MVCDHSVVTCNGLARIALSQQVPNWQNARQRRARPKQRGGKFFVVCGNEKIWNIKKLVYRRVHSIPKKRQRFQMVL
jgi:hypothetical protein